MRLENFRWEPALALTRDYHTDFAAVASLYAWNPWEEASERRRSEWLDQAKQPSADREQLVHTLLAYNRVIGNSDRATAHIEALRDPRTRVVIGGQQAGLFGGQLLVLYKALTIIVEARQASDRLGRPVVPVFWIAGEDHDLDEVNHTYVLTEALVAQKVKLNAEADKKTSVSKWSIDPEAWEEALGQLDQALMNTEFKPELMERLRTICAESDTLTDQFARIMAWLFGEYGLVLLDSDDPGIRRLESELFVQIVQRQEQLETALASAKSEIERAGYTAQADIRSGQAHLFVFHEDERLLLAREGGRFTDRKGTVSYTASELEELASVTPELLSNNVVTRPLMQEYLFPVLSVVLGPSEIAYWGLLRRAFELFGMQMPPLVPRYAFTLLEGTVQKQMGKFGLSVNDVVYHLNDRQEQWLSAQGALQLDALFEEAKAKFAELYDPVIETVSGINPGLRKLGETNRAKIVEQIAFLESKSKDAFRTQHESSLRHWERIRMSVLPGGKPQERLYSGFQFWAKYGGGWLRELVDMPLTRDGEHRIVYF